MAYDVDRARVLLFGGADDRQVLGDLWEWDGREWHAISATGPAPRTFPAMAYDRHRRRLMLFGGNRVLFGTENLKDTFLDDMWEWDGGHWQALKVAGPPSRAEAVMIYDTARRCLVLFGGYRVVDGKRTRLGDTWEWDGASWKQAGVAGPSPRNGAAMCYDPVRGCAILFGGNGPSGETWTWEGRSWTEVKPVLSAGRFNSVMVYDESRRRALRFGGWNGKTRVDETWSFEGRAWRQIGIAGPEARNHAAMVYDAQRRRLVLFGGHDGEKVFGDTWEWDGSTWSRVAFCEPRLRINNGH